MTYTIYGSKLGPIHIIASYSKHGKHTSEITAWPMYAMENNSMIPNVYASWGIIFLDVYMDWNLWTKSIWWCAPILKSKLVLVSPKEVYHHSKDSSNNCPMSFPVFGTYGHPLYLLLPSIDLPGMPKPWHKSRPNTLSGKRNQIKKKLKQFIS